MNKKLVIKAFILVCMCAIYTLVTACGQLNIDAAGMEIPVSDDSFIFDEMVSEGGTYGETDEVYDDSEEYLSVDEGIEEDPNSDEYTQIYESDEDIEIEVDTDEVDEVLNGDEYIEDDEIYDDSINKAIIDENPNEIDESIIENEYTPSNELYNTSTERLFYDGSFDPLNSRFLYVVDSLGREVIAIHGNAAHELIDNVYRQLPREEQLRLPMLYSVIHGLNISREEFMAVYERDPTCQLYLEPHIIDALFNDDITEMKRVLVHPNALFYNGEIYTFWQVVGSSESGTLGELGVSRQALLSFMNGTMAKFHTEQRYWAERQIEAQQRHETFMSEHAEVVTATSDFGQVISDEDFERRKSFLEWEVERASVAIEWYDYLTQWALSAIANIQESRLE